MRHPFSFGQLSRENNKALDKTIVYCYDNIGNITSVRTYPYTTGALGNDCTEQVYVYDTTHPDRLISVGGKSITYNSLHCPSNYNGNVFTWTKGRLTATQRGNSSQPGALYERCEFGYDGYGRRISKSYTYDPNPASTSDYSYTYNTTYTYDSEGRLIREYCTESYISGSTKTREFIYFYDETGIIGCYYSLNGATAQPYYYHKNPQGDVIAILDQNFARVVEYAYDAWGNCTILYTNKADLANSNPIRYRSYYYDRETKLYYLQSRYYNPEWRRFISPDDTAYLDPESVNGLNLYAYCNNDPVNYCDPSGHSFILTTALVLMGVGITAGLGYAAYTDYSDDYHINGSVGWQTYVDSAIIGGAIGFGIGYLGSSIASFLGSSTSFALPSFGTLNTGGALALVGGTTVTATGAQLLGGAIGISVSLFSLGADRYKPKNTGSNTSQNEFVDHLQNKYGFSNKVRRRLHDRITKRGYSNKKVEEILRKMLGLDV